MSWYYAIDRQSKGPVTEEEFQALIQSGTIKPDTLVWREGMVQWVPQGTLAGADAATPGAAPTSAPPAPTRFGACAECGRSFPTDDMVPYRDLFVCADCKPRFFQRIQEGGDLPTVMSYGGFWIRFAAKIIDNLIVGVTSFAITFVLGVGTGLMSASSRHDGMERTVLIAQLLGNAIQIALMVAYGTFFVGKFGATPGKMACRLKVVRSDGTPLTYGRAFGRVFATGVSYMTLYIGFILAAFDDEKRALHDRMCDTRVIRV